MRFETIRFAGLASALFFGSSCGGGDDTAAGLTPASNAGGSMTGGSSSSTGGALVSGGRNQGTGASVVGTGNGPSSNGGRSGASGKGGAGAGGIIGDASVGGASGADGSMDASATGGSGGSGTGGNSGSGGAGGSTSDASGNLCGTEPCASTRCAAWNCGAAVCCTFGNQSTCVHGTTTCPNPDGGGDSATLECWGGATNAYVFAKTCTQKSDCFVAAHWVGCCNVHAVGLNTSEQSRFDSFETSCGGAPPCGCCCDRVTAEDGTVVASGTALGVDCVAGLCKSTAP